MEKEPPDVLILRSTAREAIRLRPGMYLGRPGSNVRNHLLLGALCLSLAEAHCGSCTSIRIKAEGRRVMISDNGIGLSLEKNEYGMPFAERILTILYTCRDAKTHQALSHELCGIGIVVVNVLSEVFVVNIHAQGVQWRQTYHAGLADGPFEKVGETSRQGTEMSFTIEEQFAGTEPFDLKALGESIFAKPLNLSNTDIVITD